jgi:hypothetical protein
MKKGEKEGHCLNINSSTKAREKKVWKKRGEGI